jgi:hypothetical protein
MQRLSVTVIVAAVSVGAAGCGQTVERARAEGPDLVGAYVYSAAGTTGSVPWALRADLSLNDDSTYQLVVGVRVKDEDTRETDTGVYSVEGDRLRLVPASGGHGIHELRVRGDSLTLEAEWIALAVLRLVGAPRPVLVRGR